MVAVIIIAVLIVFAIISLFVRRHGESDRPEASWHRTDEVFRDPASSRTVRVWLDDAGERHYVPE